MHCLRAARLLIPAGFAIALPHSAKAFSGACAEISELWTASGVQPGETYTIRNGQLAQDCLNEIPFYSDLAGDFLAELRKYIQFHATLEALKKPPETYESASVDILGGLESIEHKVSAAQYAGHYEFETELNDLFRSANDGHLSVSFCTYGFFEFARPSAHQIALVSVDGTEIPELYLLNEAQFAGSGNVSTIQTINGKDAVEWLMAAAANQSNQDPDARMNTMFPSYAAGASGSIGRSFGAFLNNGGIWPGSNMTTLGFKNGSSSDIPTRANIALDSFANITDGQSMFEKYCLPGTQTSYNSSTTNPIASGTPTEPQEEPSTSTSVIPTFTAGPNGYPEPKFRDPYNQIMGFDLDDSTAVMFISTFESGSQYGENQSAMFSELATNIIDDAVSSGRTRLIIDLSSNGGGDIVRAFNLFKLLFPSEFPYSATRFRRHEAADTLAKTLGTLNRTDAADEGSLSYPGQVSPNQEAGFDTLERFLGDHVQYGVNVSSLYANFNFTYISSPQLPISGYADVSLNTTQPFSAENILVLTNGDCSSTCTTLANLLTNVADVRSLSLGGSPQLGPMQLMGGVRGAQSASFELLASLAEDASAILQQQDEQVLSEAEQNIALNTWPKPIAQWPIKINGGNVNLRNAYQEGDDGTPLQFAYQAADCRLFYTWENYVMPASVWQRASEVVWGGEKCVRGSEGAVGSRGNRGTAGVNGTVTSEARSGDNEKENAAVTTRRKLELVVAGLLVGAALSV